ncbi:hypothetical protein BGZ83_001069 [Gryganskiella cystojenkinii]|nr:hypothetical protein BGZ83_001069 [Gryganskiella cystojenkinii]
MFSFDLDRLSKMPLPVTAPSQTRCTKKITYLGEAIDETFTVRLCLECRKAYYELKPEPLTRDQPLNQASLKLKAIQDKYPFLSEVDAYRTATASLTETTCCNEAYFITLARKLHGGDVGIAACKSSTRALEASYDKRMEQYRSYKQPVGPLATRDPSI